MQNNFRKLDGTTLPYPLFFPDATRGEVRQLTFDDVKKVGLPGILVNTFHLLRLVGTDKTMEAGGIHKYLGWDQAMISDSGGFQVMSIAKKGGGNSTVTDEGVTFTMDGVDHHFSPEDSIRYQMTMGTDLMVVLDDFTPPDATYEEAEDTVRRTTLWAKRCKKEFERLHSSEPCNSQSSELGRQRPYLIGVVQGAYFDDLRMRSIKDLVEIGFDGYGYGGWPMKDGKFDEEMAKLIARATVKVAPTALLYGLGIGKPDDIVKCVKLGYQIFDCVLPTRDARHGRLYVYTDESIDRINVQKDGFYEFYNPRQALHLEENIPVSSACDCELCTTLTRAEFATMWRAKDERVLRLATIHNLRFYAILMEKLRK
ncbi:MAG: tRNA guanosine(34) transglycosylase Tgt [Microgenomates group bacterium]